MNKLNKYIVKLALETLLEQVRDADDTKNIKRIKRELKILSLSKGTWL